MKNNSIDMITQARFEMFPYTPQKGCFVGTPYLLEMTGTICDSLRFLDKLEMTNQNCSNNITIVILIKQKVSERKL